MAHVRVRHFASSTAFNFGYPLAKHKAKHLKGTQERGGAVSHSVMPTMKGTAFFFPRPRPRGGNKNLNVDCFPKEERIRRQSANWVYRSRFAE